MTTDFRSHRSAPLDVIRAVAITLVVVYHVATLYRRGEVAALDPVAQWFGRYGFLGVDVFFPLSGFLIVRFLTTWKGAALGRVFFLRRIFRIVPLYGVAVLAYLAACLVLGRDLDILGNLWMTSLFLTGWGIFFLGREAMPYTITWSISVEEFGYILLGLAAVLWRPGLKGVVAAMLVLPLLLRFHLIDLGHANNVIYYFPPARLDSIAIGGVAALFIHRPWPLLGALCGVLLILFLGAAASEMIRKAVLFQQVAVMSAIAIVLAERFRTRLEGPVAAMLGRVGFYSYFIYLFHFFVLEALFLGVKRIMDPVGAFWPIAALGLALTYGLAWLSFRFFEAPLLAFGRSLEPVRTAPQPAAP